MGELKSYVRPGAAASSEIIRMLNPPVRYPTVNMAERAFGTAPQHPAEVAGTYNGHDRLDPKYQLTADEHYLLILSFDNGAQYYARENQPGGF